MARILVTGGAGFIGSHLTDHLLSLGHHVTVLDNLANGSEENLRGASLNSSFRFIKGSILNEADCAAATKDTEIVYHLACLGVRHSLHSPFENHRVNAEGSLRMLEASRRAVVRKFFYISTSEIYGDIKSFPISETGLPAPKTVYGASKLAGEHYAYSYHICYGMDSTILRIFNNYGPRAHYEGDAGEVIPRTIVNILYGKRPVIFGDGSVTRDFFYVEDTARALALLMSEPNLAGEIINIGTGEEITMKTLLESIIAEMRSDLSIEYLPDRPADVPRLWVDNSKFRSLTGFKPAVTMAEGLQRTIEFYRSLSKARDLSKEIVLRNWES